MRRRSAVLLGLSIAALAVGSVARGEAPPGATARCNDGTYSFSQTHSGTCSHHAGVATWLGATGTTSAFAVDSTVLLLTRTRTAGCTLGALPDRHCSPGAYYSRLSRALICSAGFH